MFSTRSRISILLAGLLCGLSSFASDQSLSDELYPPLKVKYSKVVEVIEAIRKQNNFVLLEDLVSPPARYLAYSGSSPVVQFIQEKFDRTQKFLFGENRPFQLILCQRCDVQPGLDKGLIFVDVLFIEKLLSEHDPNLLELDIAHAFAHYLLEYQVTRVAMRSPAGNLSRLANQAWFLTPEQLKKITVRDRIQWDANYHAEVDVFAAAILAMQNIRIPDFRVVVDLYRDSRMVNNPRRPLPPPHIYTDQETRVNTINWIRKNWPLSESAAITEEPFNEKKEQGSY